MHFVPILVIIAYATSEVSEELGLLCKNGFRISLGIFNLQCYLIERS